MASFLIEACKGLEAEWNAQPDFASKLSRLSKMSLILLGEIAALFGLVPYALKCQSIYRSLPDLDDVKRHTSSRFSVAIKREVSYDDSKDSQNIKHRNLIDIYVPTSSSSETASSLPSSLPVILFVHGGVWASGERYHYAPMATRMAQEGFLVAVPSYTLYPDTLVPTMVKEVSDALTWVQDHIKAYGGNKENIILVGHSSGAHLAAMVVLARTAASSILSSSLIQGVTDSRMPSLLCCMAGVYHIARHFEFEKARDVHQLSMMKRAVGGFEAMDAVSPSVILSGEANWRSTAAEPSFFNSFDLFGAAIPHRLNDNQISSAEPPLSKHPATIVFSSLADHMVPFHESQEYVSKLHQRKVDAKHLIYNHTRHGDFATDWTPTRRGQAPKPLPPFASDLLGVIRRVRSASKPLAAMRFQGLSHLSKI